MARLGKKDHDVFQLLVIAMACVSIHGIGQIVGPTLSGYAMYVLFPATFAWFFICGFKLRPEAKLFVAAICMGCFLRVLFGVGDELNVRRTLFARLLPVFLMSMHMCHEKKAGKVTVFVLAFFVVECLMSFYERNTMSHLISYSGEEDTQATSTAIATSEFKKFRSFALMFHPLFNANTVSVAMGFILCSDKMKLWFKALLLALGVLALWGFNSRAVWLVWTFIFMYRFALYNRKWWQACIAVSLLCLVVPPLLALILDSDILGRLEGFDFSDSSSQTRLFAITLFLGKNWDFQSIVVGGDLIFYPGTDIPLENGILLDLCYWGWVVGSLKIVSEFLVTYFALHHFPMKAKFIVLLSFWGLAFMNNNSHQSWLMPMFVLFCIGFAPFQSKKEERMAKNLAKVGQEESLVTGNTGRQGQLKNELFNYNSF